MLSTSTSLDMYEVFGDTIETFRSRKAKITDGIWAHQIEGESWELDEGM
jgi:hypothetical protein